MIKLGMLFSAGGMWNGKRVISKSWISESTESKVKRPLWYGYMWYQTVFDVFSKSYPSYRARGGGGQSIVVVPDLDLVVAMTAGNAGEFLHGHQQPIDIVGNEILRTITEVRERLRFQK